MLKFNTHSQKVLQTFGFLLCLVNTFAASAPAFAQWRHVNTSPAGQDLGFVAHPVSRLLEVGQHAELAMIPKGAVKTVQWRKNGNPIEGANGHFLKVTAAGQNNEMNPDRYDVLIGDAFGTQAVSRAATVTTVDKNSPGLNEAVQSQESIKLQNLLNLVDIFQQAAFRIEEGLGGDLLNEANLQRYNTCPEDLKAEWTTPADQIDLTHRAVKLEFKNCSIPRSDAFGNEAGSVVSGTLIQSVKQQTSDLSNSQHTEIFAKNLNMVFPYSRTSDANPTIDFDIRLSGKLVHTAQTTRLGANTQRTLQEYQWTSGTQIENPQTGVSAKIISGKYSIEIFSESRMGRAVPTRETRFFNNLKLKVGKDDVMIKGLVNRINQDQSTQRSGQFEIWLNGKAILKASSAVSPLYALPTQLPHSPKLNGFFNNDHQATPNGTEMGKAAALR